MQTGAKVGVFAAILGMAGVAAHDGGKLLRLGARDMAPITHGAEDVLRGPRPTLEIPPLFKELPSIHPDVRDGSSIPAHLKCGALGGSVGYYFDAGTGVWTWGACRLAPQLRWSDR
jgi:hypothetical protein